jgi:hypothetical protein
MMAVSTLDSPCQPCPTTLHRLHACCVSPDLVSGVALLDATSAFNGSLSSPEARAAAAKGQSGMSLWRGLAPLGWHRAIRLPGTAGYRWG